MLRTQASADESSWVTCEMEKYHELNTATLHGQQAEGWIRRWLGGVEILGACSTQNKNLGAFELPHTRTL